MDQVDSQDAPGARNPRYLIDACMGQLGERGGGGSLKYVLWWLRDYSGEMYVTATKAVIRYLLEHHDVRLVSVVGCLRWIPEAATFQEMIREGADGNLLVEHLDQQPIGRWVAVINRTALNLLSVAMRLTDADIYIAASNRGAVIKVRRGILDFPMTTVIEALGPGWVQPYHNMGLLKRSATDEDFNRIVKVIEKGGA